MMCVCVLMPVRQMYWINQRCWACQGNANECMNERGKEEKRMNILFIVVLGIFLTPALLSRLGLIMQQIPIGSIMEGNQWSRARSHTHTRASVSNAAHISAHLASTGDPHSSGSLFQLSQCKRGQFTPAAALHVNMTLIPVKEDKIQTREHSCFTQSWWKN